MQARESRGPSNAAFHHLGVACRSLDAEEPVFTALGYVREREDVVDPLQGVRARFLVGAGPRLELLENLPGSTALSDLLARGIAFYHLAYEVDDVGGAADALGGAGAKRVTETLPAVGFGGRPMCFCALPNMVLVELIGRGI